MYSFPDKRALKDCLFNHPSLNTAYDDEKGVRDAVSSLAAERFAGKELVPAGLKNGARFALGDLHRGKDGFTGKPLSKLDISDDYWPLLSMHLEMALKDCAN